MNSESTEAGVHGETSAEQRFLYDLGTRVRNARARRGLTRKELARESDVSERYLALLESGNGNISILLLQRIAHALNLELSHLFRAPEQGEIELDLIQEFLRRLSPETLTRVRANLVRDYAPGAAERAQRIALVGLRGAGKSTLGELLARELALPFVELDQEIEREAGTGLSEIFLLYGQQGYRRYERRCLEQVLQQQARCVIATGGSIVSEPATYDLLRSACKTVWLKTSPLEHMARVVAQGDTRPMAGNDQAMDDLRRILEGRAALYAQADATVDTAGKTVKQSLHLLRRAIESSPSTEPRA